MATRAIASGHVATHQKASASWRAVLERVVPCEQCCLVLDEGVECGCLDEWVSEANVIVPEAVDQQAEVGVCAEIRLVSGSVKGMGWRCVGRMCAGVW